MRNMIVTDGLEHGVTLTVPSETAFATVRAWPEGIQVEIHAKDGELTFAQAEELGSALHWARGRARQLDYDPNEGIGKLIERGA